LSGFVVRVQEVLRVGVVLDAIHFGKAVDGLELLFPEVLQLECRFPLEMKLVHFLVRLLGLLLEEKALAQGVDKFLLLDALLSRKVQ
jgi:hypothetical protein